MIPQKTYLDSFVIGKKIGIIWLTHCDAIVKYH